MQDDPSYVSYRRYAEMIGSPVLEYEAWARLRFKLDKNEPKHLAEREKWLAADVAKYPRPACVHDPAGVFATCPTCGPNRSGEVRRKVRG
jgi:hypothetical protein